MKVQSPSWGNPNLKLRIGRGTTYLNQKNTKRGGGLPPDQNSTLTQGQEKTSNLGPYLWELKHKTENRVWGFIPLLGAIPQL